MVIVSPNKNTNSMIVAINYIDLINKPLVGDGHCVKLVQKAISEVVYGAKYA